MLEKGYFNMAVLRPRHSRDGEVEAKIQWGPDIRTRVATKDCIAVIQDVVPCIHIATCWQGLYVEDLLETASQYLKSISGYTSWIKYTKKGDFSDIDRWQVGYLKCGCPWYEKTMNDHRKRICGCLPPKGALKIARR